LDKNCFAKVAFDVEGEPGEYSESLDLPDLIQDASIVCWMKVERDLSADAPFFSKKYKYKIIIE
jgi:hypothetical protein